MSQSTAKNPLSACWPDPPRALAVVGMAHERSQSANVVGWLEVSEAADPGLAAFGHALELERGYADAVVGFQDESPPFYGTGRVLEALELAQMAKVMHLRRILCLVAHTAEGILIGRGYDDIDVAWIVDTEQELARFVAEFEQRVRPHPTGGSGRPM